VHDRTQRERTLPVFCFIFPAIFVKINLSKSHAMSMKSNIVQNERDFESQQFYDLEPSSRQRNLMDMERLLDNLQRPYLYCYSLAGQAFYFETIHRSVWISKNCYWFGYKRKWALKMSSISSRDGNGYPSSDFILSIFKLISKVTIIM
jgi:hypothetical protein